MPWIPPKENRELKQLIGDVCKSFSDEYLTMYVITSIQLDKMCVEIVANGKNLIRRTEDLPDESFDDVAMEKRLLEGVIKDLIAVALNKYMDEYRAD